MSSKKTKPVSEIITQAAKDIKERLEEDTKKIKEELNKPLFPKKEEKKQEEPQKVEEQSSKEDKPTNTSSVSKQEEPKDTIKVEESSKSNSKQQDKKKKKHKVIKIIFAILLILTVVGAIFIYRTLVDKNRSTYNVRDQEITELIKKNYIDGFKDTSSTGKFTFSLPEDDVNELLSKVDIDNKYIDNIYYKRGSDYHHYFYLDLDIPIITTRLVVDTVVASLDDVNKTITLQVVNGTIGKLPTWSYLKQKEYVTEDLLNNLFTSSNLPLTYSSSTDTFLVEPLKFIDAFPLGDVAGMMFDFVKEDLSAVSLDPISLGFQINFAKFRNTNYVVSTETTEVPDLEARIKSAYDELDYDSLPLNEAHKIASLTDKELSAYLNESFTKWEDDEVTSGLTSNIAKFSINKVNVEFIDDANMRLVYDVSVNGYICNVNQNITYNNSSELDFEFIMFGGVKISSGLSSSFSGVSNGHVKEILDLVGVMFEGVGSKHPNIFKGMKTNCSLAIDLDFISDYVLTLPDGIKLMSLITNTSINSQNNCLDFRVTRFM